MHLLAHPAVSRGPVSRFEADARRGADGWLRLAWRLDAVLTELRLPPATTPGRADGLWRRTCFEAFIGRPGSAAYCELNFAPSGEWAAYGFSGYRAGMAPLDLPAAPQARWQADSAHLVLEAAIRVADLPGDAHDGPLRLGLAAVIEEQSGTITYWALTHPAGKPDFHHEAGFILELAELPSRTGRGNDGS